MGRTPPRIALLVALLQLGAGAAEAQLTCQPAKVPLGLLHGQATVEYRLQGSRPDTGSLAVVAVAGLSARGARSALVRQLAACKLADRPRELTLARQAFVFAGADLRFGALEAVDSASPPILEPPPDDSARVFTRAEVEEQPRVLRCRALTAISRQPNDLGGDVRAEFVVLPDGRVDPATIVVAVGAPPLRNDAARAFARCRYVPGRRYGVAVAVKVREDAVLH